MGEFVTENIPPEELGVGHGVQWREQMPDLTRWLLESKDTRSKLTPSEPQSSDCTNSQDEGDNIDRPGRDIWPSQS